MGNSAIAQDYGISIPTISKLGLSKNQVSIIVFDGLFRCHRYRGRKEWPTQNVHVACTFDHKFTYILASWEGSTANSRVLHSVLARDEPLLIPDVTKLEDKSIHNWDNQHDLWGDKRATSVNASGLSRNQNGCNVDLISLHSDRMMRTWKVMSLLLTVAGGEPPAPDYTYSQKLSESSRSNLKWKASLISVMEDICMTIAASIDKLSVTLGDTFQKVVGSKYDVHQNSQIYAAIESLGLNSEVWRSVLFLS